MIRVFCTLLVRFLPEIIRAACKFFVNLLVILQDLNCAFAGLQPVRDQVLIAGRVPARLSDVVPGEGSRQEEYAASGLELRSLLSRIWNFCGFVLQIIVNYEENLEFL